VAVVINNVKQLVEAYFPALTDINSREYKRPLSGATGIC
jgi:hypothetical protein